ncbi:MAG: hypothetical protein ACRD20_02355 [Terriglobales bacterium]
MGPTGTLLVFIDKGRHNAAVVSTCDLELVKLLQGFLEDQGYTLNIKEYSGIAKKVE